MYTGACSFLFETDLSKGEETEDFINAVLDLFVTLQYLILAPVWLSPYLFPKSYKRHAECWSIIRKTGMLINIFTSSKGDEY